MISFDEYATFDATALAEAVRRRSLSAAEVLEAAIARAEAVNPALNAIASRLYEPARRQAAHLVEGAFAGVPWAVKDLGHPIAGAPLTNGSRAFRDAVGSQDAELIGRFRTAGLATFATSTSPEFGLTVTTESTLYGPTRNPWNLERSAGGSSGGAAALVAAGVLPAAHATDGGGSIRIPASCCGLFGLKPSRGRTPVGLGRTEGWNGLGVSHAVTRSVRDSAALLDATSGREAGSRSDAPNVYGAGFLDSLQGDPAAHLRRRARVAVMLEPFSDVPVHGECQAAALEAARLCEELGLDVEEARPALDGQALGRGMMAVVSAQTAATINAREDELGRKLRQEELEIATWELVAIGRSLKATDLIAADLAFMAAAEALGRFQERFDLILSPTLAAPPVRLGKVSLDQSAADYGAAVGAYSPFTAVYNQTGAPAMSVPLHWSEGACRWVCSSPRGWARKRCSFRSPPSSSAPAPGPTVARPSILRCSHAGGSIHSSPQSVFRKAPRLDSGRASGPPQRGGAGHRSSGTSRLSVVGPRRASASL